MSLSLFLCYPANHPVGVTMQKEPCEEDGSVPHRRGSGHTVFSYFFLNWGGCFIQGDIFTETLGRSEISYLWLKFNVYITMMHDLSIFRTL